MNLFDYYQSYRQYFWVWEEDAQVLAVTGGSTIGFREQIEEILTGMAEQGLPPFGSFLLAMIATNRTMDNPVENVASIIRAAQQPETMAQYTEIVEEAVAFLKLLQTLPKQYTIGKRRQVLLQTIFADSHNRLNIPTSRGIATGLKNNEKGRRRLLGSKELNRHVFYKDFRTIALLSRKFPTAQSVIDAMGDLPELDEADLPLLEDQDITTKAYKDFVAELMDNPKTFHAGALIKSIWAGFNIPIFNAHPSEQPLGGVSDLSNKGDFDKLLISEFANDDLVFMSRIANNEALYIHREMPPVKDQVHRSILIDISLKTWGTPKILGYATYIAIARHPKSMSDTNAFVVGDDHQAISCDSTDAIIDSLQKVAAGLQAAKGLAAFLEANKHYKQLELFFITTAEAIKYPGVQKLLTDHYSLFKYIITTNAEGEISFYRRSNAVQKHLQTIRLPLEQLWTRTTAKPEKEEKAVVPVAAPGFVPLLMPTPVEIRKTMPLGDEVYIVAHKCLFKRSLDQNNKANKGWQIVLRNLPANSRYELGKMENGQIMFLSFNPQHRELAITNLHSLQQARTGFDYWSGKRYPDFLSNKSNGFTYLVKNPAAYHLEPDFNTGLINVSGRTLNSGSFAIDYPGRQKEMVDLHRSIFGSSILSNVSEVYIDSSKSLAFNRHRLVCHANRVGFYSQGSNLKYIKSNKHPQTGAFTFRDGSTITIDRCGFAHLVSSNQDIPDCFISLALDMRPGMATATHFAGNEFFYNNSLGGVNVKINTAGKQPLSVIKLLRDHYPDMGLREAKEIVDGSPQTIPAAISYHHAVEMIEKLKAVGCGAVICNIPDQLQSIISIDAFYQQNIAIFIQHILDNATPG